MTLESLSPLLGEGGANLNDQLHKILQEIQGETISIVTGAAGGTKMDLAGIREEDTIKSAIALTDASGVAVDITPSTLTIQETHATGAITVTGAQTDADTLVVNAVTYTFKTAPTARTHILISSVLGVAADNIAAAINSYETRHVDQVTSEASWRIADVVATAPTRASGVVTLSFAASHASGLPTANDTIQIGASTYTFKTLSASATQVTIGENVKATLENLKAAVNANSTDVVLGAITLGASGNPSVNPNVGRVAVTAVAGGTGGNSLALVATSTGSVMTVSAATLLGGLGTSGVVLLRAVADATDGTEITLTESAGNLTVTATAGHLVAGTATGGLKSVTSYASKHLLVTWYNKNP